MALHIYIKLFGCRASGTIDMYYDNASTVLDFKKAIMAYVERNTHPKYEFDIDPDDFTIHDQYKEFEDDQLIVDIIKTTKYGFPATYSTLLCTTDIC